MSLFVFFISLLLVAQHVSGNQVPIIRSWRLRDVIALCWYVSWLQEGCQVRLAGSASMVVMLVVVVVVVVGGARGRSKEEDEQEEKQEEEQDLNREAGRYKNMN